MALDRLTKVDGGGISTTSDYRVGIITASKFVGPIEGDVTGSITATDGTFSGNVTIGGTLTYEDVTNIDSVGIITARDGIDCNADLDVDGHTNLDNVSIAGVTTHNEDVWFKGATSGRDVYWDKSANELRFNDNAAIYVGSNRDAFFMHDGSSTRLQDQYGHLFIGGNLIQIKSGYLTEEYARMDNNSKEVKLFHNSIEKFTTKSTGVVVHGTTTTTGLGVTSLAVAGVSTFSGDITITNTAPKLILTDTDNNSDFRIKVESGQFDIDDTTSSNATRFRIYSNGEILIPNNVGFGVANPSEKVDVDGNIKLTGDITISSAAPTINLTETNGDPDYRIFCNGGIFNIVDVNNSVNRIEINSNRTTINNPTLINDNILYVLDTITHWGDDNTKIRFPAADTITAETGGNERVRIDSSGNVTVGFNGNSLYFQNGFNNSTARIVNSGSSNNSNLRFLTRSSGTEGERLRITSDGQTIVNGTTNLGHPNMDDIVVGDGTGNRGITIAGGTSNYGSVAFGDSNDGSGADRYEGLIEYFHNDDSLTLYTAHTPKLKITSGGNVQVNGGALHLDASGELAVFETDTNLSFTNSAKLALDFSGNVARIRTSVNGSATIRPLAFYTGNDERLRIGSNGGHTITCAESHYSANLSEMNTNNLALNIIKTRQGQTKGIGIGAIGNTNSNTGIQCYDTSDNSANPLLINPFGGNVGIYNVNPKSRLHLGASQDIRIGGQYGGMASMQQQVSYSSGYTGTHWQFKTTDGISWSFDGVLIVHGSGGSSYGSEVVHIKIVYSRESGATNSGDSWRNGSVDYNVETLEHGQVGLAPSSGDLTIDHDSTPGGATGYSLLKLGWSASGQGVGVWSKLIGNFYWGAPSSGDVEIQDKDGNIVFNSNP